MSNLKENYAFKITHKDQLEVGIDEEGVVDEGYQNVETHYAPLEAVYVGPGYLGIIVDDPGDFLETRILFETLEAMGWKRPDEATITQL